MKSAFFISDVHLKAMASPSGEALLFLLKKAQAEAELFVVLGDLFDLWVGDGQAFRKAYAPVIDEFRKLKRSCRILYFEGNHDFHLAKFWQNELGFEVYTGPKNLEFQSLKIWAEHGDEINREDRGYLFLRWFLRTKPMTMLIHKVPSKLVKAFGDRASRASRGYTSSLENYSKQIFRNHAQRLRKDHVFDLLLVGHSHTFDDFSFSVDEGTARLINLGSWFDGPRYLKISGGRVTHEKI